MNSETRSILVTGCSSGIGLYCARKLAEAGWQVIAGVRSPEDVNAMAAEPFAVLHLDYSDENSIDQAFSQSMDLTGGRLDALFNNGAYGQPGAVEDLTIEVLRAQFEANFFGWHALTRLAVPVMRTQGGGRIVHCSSILGWVPYRWRGAYNASKFAIEGLMLTQRLELMPDNIQVSLIEPGPIKTEFSKNALKAFTDNVDIDGSHHAATYRQHLARLQEDGGISRFRKGPDAVYRKLDHALNAKRARAHYPVTIPTHFINVARRLLPQPLLDRLLLGND